LFNGTIGENNAYNLPLAIICTIILFVVKENIIFVFLNAGFNGGTP